ncbi:uncharacterized protein B0H18DRAFT_1108373 [Fomitopsis serialis]|uniref:uncharacterized protein n=1 Tax=Fomitopsis serialis TaxID=139415 RepID=UPI002008E073|nr:uncharacterized protein B0H18DRAFT_1108373 [Neoantrodia serialis]KAH9914429.1 hypothetical protein B0H18DRAFT_1108373 [Neoantrodia serialis]
MDDYMLSLDVLQSFAGDHKEYNEDGLEGFWYPYWAKAFDRDGRFNPNRVFAAPQYPLTKLQLKSNGALKKVRKLPDFVLLYMEGHRGVKRRVTSSEVRNYEAMLAHYKGDCIVDDHAILAVCEIKTLPYLSPDIPEHSYEAAFERDMHQYQTAAKSGAFKQLTLLFSALADEGRHVEAIAAVAAVGPFFSIANCEDDQIEFLSNNTDPTYRQPPASEQQSDTDLEYDSVYSPPLEATGTAHQPARGRPRTLRPAAALKKTVRYGTTDVTKGKRTVLASASRPGVEPSGRAGPSQRSSNTTMQTRRSEQGTSAMLTAYAVASLNRQRILRPEVPKKVPTSGTMVTAAEAPGAPFTRGRAGAPRSSQNSGVIGGDSGASAHTDQAGMSAVPSNTPRVTSARVVQGQRSTATRAARSTTAAPPVHRQPVRLAGALRDAQTAVQTSKPASGPHATASPQRVVDSRTPGPSRIPRRSGGPADMSRNVAAVSTTQKSGTSIHGPQRTASGASAVLKKAESARTQAIRQQLEQLREPASVIRELEWTEFERWTDPSAEKTKDRLLEMIIQNNPQRQIEHPHRVILRNAALNNSNPDLSALLSALKAQATLGFSSGVGMPDVGG